MTSLGLFSFDCSFIWSRRKRWAWVNTLMLLTCACASVTEHRDAVTGAAVGCLGGYAACLLAKGNPAVCAAACVAGAAGGYLLGHHLDDRRHRLEAAAQDAKVALAINDVYITSAPKSENARPPSSAEAIKTGKQDEQDKTADKNGLVAEINSGDMFPSGSATLTPAGAQKFRVLAKVYAPAAAGNGHAEMPTKLLVTGHTDSTGDPEANQKLSEARARTVAGLLVSTGVPPGSLYIKGAGASQPIADNDSAPGRDMNRRVEILEIDTEENLARYALARQEDRSSLRFSTTVHEEIKPPPPVTARARPPTAARTPPLASPPPLQDMYGFAGTPALPRQSDLLSAIGPSPRRLHWQVVPTAYAAEEEIRPCYLDPPRVSGAVMRYPDGSKVTAHKTFDYLPGMYGGGWEAAVGQSRVGIGPVTVLKDDAQPLLQPTVYVQRAAQSVAERYEGMVSTYEGEKGVLYRVYTVSAHAPIACLDVSLPKFGQFKSTGGRLFYREADIWKQADFAPSLINPQTINPNGSAL